MNDILKRLEERDIAAWDDAYSCRARGAEAAARIRELEAELATLREARGVRPQFPILGAKGAKVDLQLVVDHGRQAEANHGQSVTRLMERGGLDWTELYAVLHNRRWQAIDGTEAMIACRSLESRYLAALEPAPVTPAQAARVLLGAWRNSQTIDVDEKAQDYADIHECDVDAGRILEPWLRALADAGEAG